MKKLIFRYFLLFNITINFSAAFSQTPILKLDDSKSYELYFVDVAPYEYREAKNFKTQYFENSSIVKNNLNSTSESLKYEHNSFRSKKTGITFTFETNYSFFVDNKLKIREFEKIWVGQKRSRNLSCGCLPEYIIYVIESDRIISRLVVRESHFDVISSDKLISFSRKPVESLDKSNKLINVSVQFPSLEQKRNFIRETKNIIGIYGLENIDLPNYCGSFTLAFRERRTKTIEKRVKNEIIKAYPEEKYDIEASRDWRTNGTQVIISCDKHLGNTFNLYEKEIEWWPYNIYPIKIFSKDKVLIDNLIEKYTKE